jgi:TonB family protein
MSLLFSVLTAAIAAPNPTTLVTAFHFERLEPLKDGSLPTGGMWLTQWKDRLTLDQLPDAIRQKASNDRAIFRLSVDAGGRLRGCDAIPGQEHADVSTAACGALSANKTFPITYAAPGQPIAQQWIVSLVWETVPQSVLDARKIEEARRGPPPAPPAPPGLYSPYRLAIGSLPDIALFAARSPHGIVGVVAKPVVDREQPDCEVRLSSGKPALDDLACQYVRSVRLRYKKPCFDCYTRWTYPLLIVFDGSRSRVRLPRELDIGSRQARVLDFKVSSGAVAALRNTVRTRTRVMVLGSIATDGSVTDCRVAQSAGSPEADVAICALIRRQKFTPALDAFGDPMPGEFFVPLDLSQL